MSLAGKYCSFSRILVLISLLQFTNAFEELPKFTQLKLLYPGWRHHGGEYHDRDIYAMIGAANASRDHHVGGDEHLHNTAALRMSWTLNRYGGRHSIGTDPVYLSQTESRDSLTGSDGTEYIYRNTAFGPFLAAKYGDPIVIKPVDDVAVAMGSFSRKQGIVRFVSYHKDHAGGHIALWDCDHFYQSRDWTTEHNMIAVEFWETPDSYCPDRRSPSPQLVQHLPREPAENHFSQEPVESVDILSRKPAKFDENPAQESAKFMNGSQQSPGQLVDTQHKSGSHRQLLKQERRLRHFQQKRDRQLRWRDEVS